MPIVGTSSLENHLGASVAGPDCSLVVSGGCKRDRNHQDLEKARAEKRIKVDSDSVELPPAPQSLVNGNEQRDEVRQSAESPVLAEKATDLTDLLNDLDDGGDSDFDDDEFGGEAHRWPETLWPGNGSVNENGVHPAHSLKSETITEVANFSAEQVQRDGDAMVQAQSPHSEAVDCSSEHAQMDVDAGSLGQAHSLQPGRVTEALNLHSQQAHGDGGIVEAHSVEPEVIAEVVNTSLEQARMDVDVGQSDALQPERVAEAVDVSVEQVQRDGDDRSVVQAHSPKAEVFSEAVGLSPEQAQRDGDVESVVQAPSPLLERSTEAKSQVDDGEGAIVQPHVARDGDVVQAQGAVRNEKADTLIVLLDSDSDDDDDDDDDFIMYDIRAGTPEGKTPVKSEPSTGQRERSISELIDAVKVEPLSRRQPESSCHLDIAVKVEAKIPRHPEQNLQTENDVKVEPGFQSPPEQNLQMENAVKVEAGFQRPPEQSLQMENAVKVDVGTAGQPEQKPQVDNAETEIQRQPEQILKTENSVKLEPGIQRQPEQNLRTETPVIVELGTERHPEQKFQLGNAVTVEPEIQRRPEQNSSLGNAVLAVSEIQSEPEQNLQMENAVMEESETQCQPEQNRQLQNAVSVEPLNPSLPEQGFQLQNTVAVEPENLRHPPQSQPAMDFQLQNTVAMDPENLRLPPPSQPELNFQLQNAVAMQPENLRQSSQGQGELDFQLPNAVSVQAEILRQPETSSQSNEVLALVPSESSQSVFKVKLELGTNGWEPHLMQGMPRPGEDLQGYCIQAIERDGSLGWALVRVKHPHPGNHLHPTLPPTHVLPEGLPFGLGCSSGFTSRNVRESMLLGEQAGPSHGWMPPASVPDVPSYRGEGPAQPPAFANGNHAVAGQAVVSPSERADTIRDVAVKTEQAGPNHYWCPADSAAVVPYRYDGTVSTPRAEIARALQQYYGYVQKAKDDRARELLAQSESGPNEPVREGSRRGLDCRPDIVAYNDMKKANAYMNMGGIVGVIPGVEVGDTFTYRHQMAIVGLHRLPNAGIDYAALTPEKIPTATAIVMMPKAGYVDDMDVGDRLCYTGQGGRKKRNQGAPFVCDQELRKGNLALAKNYERKLPVRLIRGHFGSDPRESTGAHVLGYSYDGLYTIVNYEFSVGINGFKVYKFFMERLGDQPPVPPCIAGCTAHLSWNSVKEPKDAELVTPLQEVDPTVDVKPIRMLPMDPPVEMKQICN